MTDATVPVDAPAKKSSKLPVIIGLVLALLGGAGGFFAVFSGLILNGGGAAPHVARDEAGNPLADVAFVPLPQLVVSLGPDAQSKHLIFRGDLEVPKDRVADVEAVLPRVIDVLNTYLRALETQDIEKRGALIEMRGQMMRRIQLVVGPENVNDLLVMEFVLN